MLQRAAAPIHARSILVVGVTSHDEDTTTPIPQLNAVRATVAVFRGEVRCRGAERRIGAFRIPLTLSVAVSARLQRVRRQAGQRRRGSLVTWGRPQGTLEEADALSRGEASDRSG